MVRNIQLKHSGKYVCMVHTEVDTVSAAADLIVRGMPLPPILQGLLFCSTFSGGLQFLVFLKAVERSLEADFNMFLPVLITRCHEPAQEVTTKR